MLIRWPNFCALRYRGIQKCTNNDCEGGTYRYWFMETYQDSEKDDDIISMGKI